MRRQVRSFMAPHSEVVATEAVVAEAGAEEVMVPEVEAEVMVMEADMAGVMEADMVEGTEVAMEVDMVGATVVTAIMVVAVVVRKPNLYLKQSPKKLCFPYFLFSFWI